MLVLKKASEPARRMLWSVLAIAVCMGAFVSSARAQTRTFVIEGSFSQSGQTGSFSASYVFDPDTNSVVSVTGSMTAGLRGSSGQTVSATGPLTVLYQDAQPATIITASQAAGTSPRRALYIRNVSGNLGATGNVLVYDINCSGDPCSTGGIMRYAYSVPLRELPSLTSVNPVSGPVAGGSSVTINGSGFTGASAVTFAGVAASSFVVNSATRITAVAPPGTPGVAEVRVTGPAGTSIDAGAADNFTYVEAVPVPTLTEWAMILFGTIMAGGAAIYIKRRGMTA